MDREQIGLFVSAGIVLALLVCLLVLPRHRESRMALPVHASTTAALLQLSPASAQVLAQSHGFQAIVSYTNRGFEPHVATITKGQTVRFTNNSPEPLWIAATGESGQIYPGQNVKCGQSVFDSCAALMPGDFWEFTFDTTGTWSYKNNRATSHTGVIQVN